MDPRFVWVASLVDIDRKRTGGQGGRHHRTRIYWNADVDSALSQAALEGACAAFPDQAGMLREPTANRIYGVARVQVCDVDHELLQLPSHEAEQLRVFRNKIRSDLVGNMYRVRVLNVQLLGECSVARSFAGQEMKALIVDLESGLGNRLAVVDRGQAGLVTACPRCCREASRFARRVCCQLVVAIILDP